MLPFVALKLFQKALSWGAGTVRAWWEVLQVSQTADMDVIEAAHKKLLHKVHPDKGGSDAAFMELQDAFKQAKEANHQT